MKAVDVIVLLLVAAAVVAAGAEEEEPQAAIDRTITAARSRDSSFFI